MGRFVIKRLFLFFILQLFFVFCLSLQQGISAPSSKSSPLVPQDLFLDIYVTIQEGDRSLEKHDYREASSKYKEAESKLLELKKSNPKWEPRLVDYRLKYVQDKEQEIQKRLAGLPVSETQPSIAEESAENKALENRLKEIEDKLASLEKERSQSSTNPETNKQAMELQNLFQTLQKELVQAKAARKKQLEAQQERINELTASVSSLQKELAQAKSQNRDKSEVLGLQKRLNELEEELRRANAMKTNAKLAESEVAKMRDLTQKVQSLELALQHMKDEQLQIIQKNLEQSTKAKQVVLLEERVQQLETELAQAKQEQYRMAQLNPSLVDYQQLNILKEHMQKIEQQMEKLSKKSEIQSLQTRTTENATEMEALKSRVNKLEEELARSKKREEQLLGSVTSQNVALQKRVIELEQQLAKEKEKMLARNQPLGLNHQSSSSLALPSTESRSEQLQEVSPPLEQKEVKENPKEQPGQLKSGSQISSSQTHPKKRRTHRSRSAEEELVHSWRKVRREFISLFR
ncbi:hypothetical protein IT6_10035 [Methylacidiphilum caldifontis]|uniref:hypothetical protein n=1 Tax=Methylacidiphilum caldifontis TaxID=2795386 RepID=UPI001A906B23|nr:hypothetical protein [Methylacidiphilum caldifontis]QSR88680.1 hypothetical protein IT6_10035 [Methylacidiphilum caldifontis]